LWQKQKRKLKAEVIITTTIVHPTISNGTDIHPQSINEKKKKLVQSGNSTREKKKKKKI
jgi:hypothetical protein